MPGKFASSTRMGASKVPQGCSSKYPPIISPYSGQLVKVIVALCTPIKPFPSSWTNERKKCSFLFRVHFQFTTGIEEHGVKIVQIFSVVLEFFLRQRFRICPECRSPQSRFPSEPLDGSASMGHGLMPVAFFFSENQNMLLRRTGRLLLAAATECHTGNEPYH